jgi:hypothetical protein
MEPRPGDNADMALMQLTELAGEVVAKDETTDKGAKAPKKKSKKDAGAPAEEAAAAPKRRKAKAA